MPVSKLKLVAWKGRYEFSKMRKKGHFLYLPEGVKGERLHTRDWKFIHRLNFSSNTTCRNLRPFQDMPPQKVPISNGIAYMYILVGFAHCSLRSPTPESAVGEYLRSKCPMMMDWLEFMKVVARKWRSEWGGRRAYIWNKINKK